ncbi:MAG: DUF2723 domain-containing protein [Bacteroidaceae bacterium]|nr:DUF2723 domain-containing protein [Bacteroidaceae bacterium]
MRHFRLVDNIGGWLAFAIAAFTYCSTVEPTASFWDCPEFISTAVKLEVGHPPGAPFFMLTGNMFAQWVGADKAALMINIMNALLSAGCIMFLYWTISHLARRILCKDGYVQTIAQLITIEAAAMTGALAYTWSDTFWFSAVEGEVYAYSSLFTALVFWLMLKWEDNADKPHSDRWLILIAYLTGLSIGVHLLNLLCLPAIVLVYYYRRHKDASVKGSLYALIGSFVLVAAVLYGLVPGIVKVGGWFELLFVNSLGMPFNSGLIVYIVTLTAAVVWAIYESMTAQAEERTSALNLPTISFLVAVALLGIPFYGKGTGSIVLGLFVIALLYALLQYKKAGKPIVSARVMNTALLCMLMMMIGYSSYAVIVIRSTANPPMDQNSPEDIFSLGTYLNREQYGSRPLFYGPSYTSQPKYEPVEINGQQYSRAKAKYKEEWYQVEKQNATDPDRYASRRNIEDYEWEQNMLFPRMYSSSSNHVKAYEEIMNGVAKGKDGQPTQWENMRFFFTYQVNFMYWRYFMWNFAGRQNDIQSQGELEHGNWLTGIPAIDNMRLGDQSLLPSELLENKGHNVFYCLPLLLGLLGLFWQVYNRNEEGVKQFWVVFFLFFMTGLAIVFYLNQTPLQPRERDYAYAGSFYAFAIWIGLGVAAISDWLSRLMKNRETVAALASCLTLLVPVQMVSQTWDDHDRSGRYTCRDFGQNYLNSLPDEGYPVIFTNGDNDTFPLWYNQETEGVRTDARVCNLSYLNTDWYIDQMRRPAYDSPALPIHISRYFYQDGGSLDGVEIVSDMLDRFISTYPGSADMLAKEVGDKPHELQNIIDHWLCNPDKNRQCIPTDDIVITIDKEAVRRSGMMMAADSIPDEMHISLSGRRYIGKSELMMYAMLAGAEWKRPLYIAVTVGESNYRSFANNTIQEGLAMRITPFNTRQSGQQVDADRMYDNLMNRFRFGGIENPGLYLDETVLRMVYTHRSLFGICANELIEQGDTTRALNILRKAEEAIPAATVPHNTLGGSLNLASCWMRLGKAEEAAQIALAVAQNQKEYAEWYRQLSDNRFKGSLIDMYRTFEPLIKAASILFRANKEAQASALTESVQVYMLYTLQQISSFIASDLALPYAEAKTKDSELKKLFQIYQTIMEDYRWYLSDQAYEQFSQKLEESYYAYIRLLHSDLLRQQTDEDNDDSFY